MSVYDDLKRQGFSYIPIHTVFGTEIHLHLMLQAWKSFCELPLSIKKLLVYENGTGYEYKDGLKGDRKENLHVTVASRDRLFSKARELPYKGDGRDTITHLLYCFDRAIEVLSVPILRAVGDIQIDSALPIEDVFYDKQNWLIRLLHYFPGVPVGGFLAEPHFDKSGLTVNLAETSRGLQYWDHPLGWFDMPYIEGNLTVTANAQFQLATRGKVKALNHQVVATENTSKDGRYAAVLFLRFPSFPKFDKNLGGRTQDFFPGQNYGMSHGEFSKFFS